MGIKEIDQTYIAKTYNRFPVEIVSGKGSLVYDDNGKEYIDMGSGIGVTAFGIADEQWQKAVIDQIGKVQHMSNLYYTEPCAKLAQLLCQKSGMKKVFFCNSGAEANETAIKAARKYSAEKKGNDCYTIITLINSFHGRTLTTLAATGQDHFHELFTPLTPGFVHVAAGDVAGLKETIANNKIAGIMIECVQGEGGVIPLTEDFVKAIDQIAKEEDIPLIVDEVQTGNGRTGAFYSYMHFGLQPDIVSTAKGLAGGLPIGATLLGEKVENIFGPGDNGSTFGGNPVSCAAAVSVVERIDEVLLEEVKEKSKYIFETLQGAKGIESVSGMGLMIGIKTEKPAAEVLKGCMENGVLCLTAKDKVRLLPALNIPMDVLKKAVAVIKEEAGKE
ncbi:MAG: acetylornithine/succinylornithine family transaminase [Parasporobacterium sp.]|nr:acetylornithine/succinylornithine family transaminase [Lachnospiraceae bacterium]MBR3643937.1 acetylornithine/succinylornithine family transaminase [Parasporobacterium sp.]MDO4206153.1 acetylornithine/succinylornithine family transaminase [Lachnospiraceae bacterium]